MSRAIYHLDDVSLTEDRIRGLPTRLLLGIELAHAPTHPDLEPWRVRLHALVDAELTRRGVLERYT